MHDYTAITERPGSLLTAEQQARFAHRYALARRWRRGSDILEVACGAGGGLGVWQGDLGARVVGLDFTGAVLEVARQAHGGRALLVQGGGRALLVQGDAQRLPVATGSIDTLLCFEALYYLEEPAAFAAEARRVLRPGGLLLIGQSNPGWPDFAPGPLTTRYLQAPELAALLRQAGFGGVQLYGAFPSTRQGATRRARNRLRRIVLGLGLLPTSGPLADRLKRLAYGTLTPLPAVLPPPDDAAQADALARLAPLDPARPDAVHRVLYACASA
jgi:SAM-dependent methyltransferase